ncbi:outer membrane beta-barrel protein [Cesiribacter andamanensis]|uniref:Outer membrane protein beta-barrel domain-containing protein n=1 Tax=Cesiribacter andamanensis AMV16 TaxID=1279009 RepID=M7N9G1_9BACT|nr:outer membrane beta-barrel protein [Cesiribacter andamanensis]EMR03826.1 hypothetical protein ADICEAN_01069 [Cesiribacter andamanensis AMV16]
MKHFLLTLACCLLALGTQAQHFVGARAGYGFHQMRFNVVPAPAQEWAQGATGGFIFRSMATKHLGIQIELLAEEKGWHVYPGTAEAYHLQELHATLPVQSVLVIGKGKLQFVLTAGAFASYIFGQEPQLDGLDTSDKDYYNDQRLQEWQFGLLGGGGPMLKVSKRSRLQLDARYVYTLSNRLEPNLSLDNTYDVSQFNSIQVGLSWLIRLRELETFKSRYDHSK